jgi:2'-5' RNA ligase
MSTLPRLAHYAIVAFPETHALAAIETVRRRYDPLAGVLGAHITLVFPFVDPVAAPVLRQHIEQLTRTTAPFDVELAGVSIEDGEYIFLNVASGAGRLAALHRGLYSGPLERHLARDRTYIPHITVGRLGDASALAAAAEEARRRLPIRSVARVTELAVFRLDAPGVGHVEFTVPLSPQGLA